MSLRNFKSQSYRRMNERSLSMSQLFNSLSSSANSVNHKDKIENELLQVPFLQLAKDGEYDHILFVLRNDEIDLQEWLDVSSCIIPKSSKSCINISLLNSFKGETILHSVLQYQPPVEVIDLLIHRLNVDNESMNFSPEFAVDVRGRTPLHLATSLGCDIDIIRRLLQNNQKAVFMQDSWKRYPIHLACMNPKPSFRSSTNSSLCGCLLPSSNESRVEVNRGQNNESNLCNVIELLLHIHPMAIITQDRDGYTPIDIAERSGLGKSIMYILHQAKKEQLAQRKQRKRLKQHGGSKYSNETCTTKEESVTGSNQYGDDTTFDSSPKNTKSNVAEYTTTSAFLKQTFNKRSDMIFSIIDEVTIHTRIPDEADEVSSIDSDGVSKCRRPRPQARQFEFEPEQFEI